MTHESYLKVAFEEALIGMRSNAGGPFGAVIVLNDKIVGRGHNMVTSKNDPTAHAEIVAIRNACDLLQTFHLADAVLYTTCEPCPMCLAAIYWADIKSVYYYYDRNDAANIGFSDKFIYDELEKPVKDRIVGIQSLDFQMANDLFEEWESKQDKLAY